MNRRGLNVVLELVAIALFAVKVLLHRELLNILLELIGSRDPRYVDIEFSVKTDCKCGKYNGGCLAEALLDGHDYTRAYNVLQNLRFKVHQNGYNSKSQIKEALRPEFEDTIDGHTEIGITRHTFLIEGTLIFIRYIRYVYNLLYHLFNNHRFM